MTDQKKTIQTIKFNLAVGDAKPGPVLAPILGQSQINIQAFCKDFVELTQNINEGVKLPVKINKFADKSFKVKIQCPTLNYIFEQLVLARNNEKNTDFTYISVYEIVDLLTIQKVYMHNENQELLKYEHQLKLLLSFLQTKNIRITL